jgi:hypothetical protein
MRRRLSYPTVHNCSRSRDGAVPRWNPLGVEPYVTLSSRCEVRSQFSLLTHSHRGLAPGAKLCRMKHDTASAIDIIEGALAKGSSFREADSLLVFEVSRSRAEPRSSDC